MLASFLRHLLITKRFRTTGLNTPVYSPLLRVVCLALLQQKGPSRIPSGSISSSFKIKKKKSSSVFPPRREFECNRPVAHLVGASSLPFLLWRLSFPAPDRGRGQHTSGLIQQRIWLGAAMQGISFEPIKRKLFTTDTSTETKLQPQPGAEFYRLFQHFFWPIHRNLDL